MAEYIERTYAIGSAISGRVRALPTSEDGENWIRTEDVRQHLLNIPAADVRPVVLCRDCVNYVESDEANGEKMCVIDAEWCEEDGCYYGFNSYTEPDWFCAGGKKREES